MNQIKQIKQKRMERKVRSNPNGMGFEIKIEFYKSYRDASFYYRNVIIQTLAF
jgi:hypothetical protein